MLTELLTCSSIFDYVLNYQRMEVRIGILNFCEISER